ncbi:HNH endonuclease [Flavobacterium sp. 2]|uniref:HNH endonuclease n=1 Tax=Flavobacterium sp. 2 TaxID=308053 RepID=UPI003CFA664D
MRKIDKPTITAAEVFPICVSTVGNAAFRGRLTACQTLINNAENEFENKITKGLVHTILTETLVNGNVTNEDLKKLYTGQMVAKPQGRAYYDKLIMSAPQGICPLCSHGEATTLDHYLPKTKFPRLSVVPINLVPSCKDCNTGKLADCPTGPTDETLHPYFDNIENEKWLIAEVNKTDPLSLKFGVSAHPRWSALLSARVVSHLHCFDLKKLYASQAARRLSGMKYNLERIFSTPAGTAGVKKYLADEADSYEHVNLNSWESAMYRALAEDDWFCSGGFRFIA